MPNRIEKRFNQLKNKNDVFKIKYYEPVVARIGFTNIFTFKNPENVEIYKSLELLKKNERNKKAI